MQSMVRDNPSMQQRVIRQLIAVLKRASPQMVKFVAENERELMEVLFGVSSKSK